MTNQKWIEGHEGKYSVDTFGRVYSHRHNGVKKLSSNVRKDGYEQVVVSVDNVRKTYSVHRLVASAFIGQNDDLTVNHKDGNKNNNRLENLEYCTQAENNRHAFDTGLKKGRKGSAHHFAKLNENDVILIRFLWENRHINKLTQRQMATVYGVSYQTISDVIAKKVWPHV